MMHYVQIVAWIEITFGIIALILHAIRPRLDLYRVGVVLAVAGVLLFVLLRPLNAGIP